MSSGTKRSRADFDMLSKREKKEKEEKREKYRTRRKKGWMGKHVVNSWVSGSCAEDNSDWSVAAGRLTRLVAFGSSSLPRLAQSHSNRASVRVLCRPLSVVSLFSVCVCAYLWGTVATRVVPRCPFLYFSFVPIYARLGHLIVKNSE